MKKIILSTLAIALMAPTSVVFANDDSQTETRGKEVEMRGREAEIRGKQAEIKAGIENGKAKLAQKRLEFQDKKEKMEQQRCKNIETRISTRTKRYENNGKMLETVYGNMQTRLTRLVERLTTAGADTTKLKTDIATLDAKIAKLKTDQAAFMLTLKDSQTFVCEKSEGEFKNKLTEARKVPEIIKTDRKDIKDFFNTTIKADLQAIRKTLAEKEETTPKTTQKIKTDPATTTTAPAGPTL